MFYPPEAETPRRDVVAPSVLPRGLQPERIAFDLPTTPYADALRSILATAIEDPVKIESIVAALVQGEEEFSTEVRAGVVVPHARVPGIREPVLFLGTSPDGIDFPHARQPANLIFVLLSPAELPQEHLRSLAEIALLVSREEYVQELLGGITAPAAQEEEEEEEAGEELREPVGRGSGEGGEGG
jgi:mannitol/fructose-specific phosphotransferase system IIA component (Ntr-type)